MSERIFVVEDNEDLAYLLSYILKREGFEVTELHDGKRVEECVATEAPPAAVLLDLMLPYAKGFELLETIRNSESWGNVPVLMLTAKSQEDDIVRALDGKQPLSRHWAVTCTLGLTSLQGFYTRQGVPVGMAYRY